MAISVGITSSGYINGGSTSGTAGIILSGGELITVTCSYYQPGSTATISAPTDDNGTFTLAKNDQLSLGGDGFGFEVYYQYNAAPGTHNIVVPVGGTNPSASYVVTSWTGAVTNSGVFTLSTNSADSSTLSSAQTRVTGATSGSPAVGDLVLGVLCQASGTGVTNAGITAPPSGYTDIISQQDTATDVGAEHCYKIATSTTPPNITWTWSDASTLASAGAVMFFKQSVGGTNYTLTAAQGTYTISGKAANKKLGLPVTVGAYALTGQTTNLTYSANHNKVLGAAQGTYSIVGQTTQRFTRAIKAVSTTATYNITGPTTNFSYRTQFRSLMADTGTYNWVAGGAFADYSFSAVKGTYGITGQNTVLSYQANGSPTNYNLIASRSSYSLTGQTTALTYNVATHAYTLTAVKGTQSITPITTNLTFIHLSGKVLSVTPGQYRANPNNTNLFFIHPGTAPSTGQWLWHNPHVFEVSTTGKVAWTDYIPITYVTVSGGVVNRFDDVGAIGVTKLTSVTGLVPWVDYTPVAQVSLAFRFQWKVEGYIPCFIIA